jgi:excisionase family DNA binding protein
MPAKEVPAAATPIKKNKPALVIPVLFSVPEAALMLGISRRLMWTFVQSGDIPIRKIGRRTLIQRSEIEKFARKDHATTVRP